MTAIQDYRPAAYFIMLSGVLIAGAASLVPLYHVGYRLDLLALTAILTPFALYGMLSETLRGPWLLGSGLLILAVCLAVVVNERYLDYDGYRDGILHWMPVAVASIVLTAAYLFGQGRPVEARAEHPWFTGEVER